MDKNILLSYQPSYYKTSKVIGSINNTNAIELEKLNNSINSALEQFFVKTATFTLDRWEKELGIKTNLQLSIEQRRSKVLAKLRIRGTMTKQAIKNIAESYVAKADVITNNPDYSFLINLVSSDGFPYSLEDFYEIIEEFKPAHLRANYKMTSKTKDNLILKTITLCGETIRVFPYQITNISTKGKINIALGQTQSAEIITILPKGEI